MPASGSLRSTANDLLRLLAFNLGEESPLRDAMVLQRVPGRSLGWGRSTLGGEAIYGHEGGREGYRSAVVFNPRTRTGIVVLTNTRADDSPMALARYLLFGGDSRPAAIAAPGRPANATLDAAEMAGYEGAYRLQAGTDVRIAVRGGYLLLDEAGQGITTFFPSARDVFFANTADARLEFTRDPAGRVTGLTLWTDGAPQSAAVRSQP